MTSTAYAFRYHQDSESRTDVQRELQELETLRYLQNSIALLTGGCEICTNANGFYCAKHQHPVKAGDPRCSDFSRRFPSDPREVTKAEAERLVREKLGLSPKAVKRVIGEARA